MVLGLDFILRSIHDIFALFFGLLVSSVSLAVCDGCLLYVVYDCGCGVDGIFEGVAVDLYFEGEFDVVVFLVDFPLDDVGEHGGFCASQDSRGDDQQGDEDISFHSNLINLKIITSPTRILYLHLAPIISGIHSQLDSEHAVDSLFIFIYEY